MFDFLAPIWNTLIMNPMVNVLMWIYTMLAGIGIPGAYGIAIIIFTLLIRLVTLPFYNQSQQAMKKQQQLMASDEWKEMQKKYAKDKEKLSQEQMKMYQQAGVNPLGGCLPALIPWPVMIGLYQSITMVMGAQPEQLMDLAKHLYQFIPTLAAAVPVNSDFLGLNLAGMPSTYGGLYYVAPALVLATTWIQQKMMTVPNADPQSAQMNQSMQLMMPLFIGYISLSFPVGLSLYWIVFNVIGIIQQYMTSGWGNLLTGTPFAPSAPVANKGKKNVGTKS
ncbi:MAG: YidC/Oxa1 family membrane protein insertase [Chloroflexi bacterium]|nr:YidC/Oxa1 family membrane protein insertase [Chloroflexota bacterium]